CVYIQANSATAAPTVAKGHTAACRGNRPATRIHSTGSESHPGAVRVDRCWLRAAVASGRSLLVHCCHLSPQQGFELKLLRRALGRAAIGPRDPLQARGARIEQDIGDHAGDAVAVGTISTRSHPPEISSLSRPAWQQITELSPSSMRGHTATMEKYNA